jgi:hypothetical protein
MAVKKKYNVGDTVWIYGISANNVKSTQATVIKVFTIDYGNYNNEPYYLIEVPTEIEPLLEVRTWHTISQTKDGHVGGIREVVSDPDATRKFLANVGMNFTSEDEEEFTGDGHDGMGSIADDYEDGPSADEIHAALEKSRKNSEHGPLITKDSKPKRRNYHRKKKV